MRKIFLLSLVVLAFSCRKSVETPIVERQTPVVPPVVSATQSTDSIYVNDSVYLKKGEAYVVAIDFLKLNRVDTAMVQGRFAVYGKYTTTSGITNSYVATPEASFQIPVAGITSYRHYFLVTVVPNTGDVINWRIDSVTNTVNRYTFTWQN